MCGPHPAPSSLRTDHAVITWQSLGLYPVRPVEASVGRLWARNPARKGGNTRCRAPGTSLRSLPAQNYRGLSRCNCTKGNFGLKGWCPPPVRRTPQALRDYQSALYGRDAIAPVPSVGSRIPVDRGRDGGGRSCFVRRISWYRPRAHERPSGQTKEVLDVNFGSPRRRSSGACLSAASKPSTFVR